MAQPRLFAVIMAGGIGSRFWPKSRVTMPKQFLNLLGEDSLIQSTFKRLRSLVSMSDIYVVSTIAQSKLITSQLNEFKSQNLILEPFGKNTAPCIGLAALHLKKIDPDGVMVVLPSDHVVQNLDAFIKALTLGRDMAYEHEALLTIGIKPTFPATGYGYIQHDKKIHSSGQWTVHKVKTFAEKPDIEVARLFLESGDFLWNSGIFIWQVSTILQELEDKMPDLYDGLTKIDAVLGTEKEEKTVETVYRQIRSESIDYGVMEKAEKVLVLKGDFGWNDVGSWDEVHKVSKKDQHGNVLEGNCLCLDASNCLVDTPNRLTALIGVQNLIVVDTPDALLICSKEHAQEVKQVVDMMRRKKMDKYL